MTQDANELQTSMVNEFHKLADRLRLMAAREGAPEHDALVTLERVFRENPASLVGIDLVGAFPPQVLLPDGPAPPLFRSMLRILRLLRSILPLALVLIIWSSLWTALSAYGRASGRHLPFLAGWVAGSFQPAQAAHHVRAFIALTTAFSYVMGVTAVLVTVSVVIGLLRSEITAKVSKEVVRRHLGADLVRATILLASGRTPLLAPSAELSSAATAATRMSGAAAQLAEATNRAYGPMTGFGGALEAWSERVSQLDETLKRALAGTQAVSADLAEIVQSQTVLLRDQREFYFEAVQAWRDHTDRFIDALSRTLDNMSPSGLNEVPQEISVSVYLDSDDASTAERVIRYVDEFVELLGYDGPIGQTIEHGSFLRRSLAKIKVALTSDEVRDLIVKAERAVEVHYLDSEQAVSNMIGALADVPNACIQVGSILFIKYSGPQGPVVLSKNLTPKEIKTLERFPGIQKEPHKVLEYLAIAQESIREA
jgi:hypothetical protein